TTTVTLVVNAPPDFTLSAAPPSRAFALGACPSYTLTLCRSGGFSDQVTLSVSGLPNGATGGFTPNPATTSSTLSVSTSPSTPTGTGTVTICTAVRIRTRTPTVALVVNAPADFTLSAAPASRTVTQSASPIPYTTLFRSGGFSDQVTLSVSGLPNGATGGFTPNPATTSSTLSVSTSPSTPTEIGRATSREGGGSLTRTTTVTHDDNAPAHLTPTATPASRP